ncbi:MAG: 2-hydroxyacyl-CoA dehydratase [Deltaproteobacteria bacterium]|nr:2-hydroxyacyl-CoA dehydratase [Deltaproteobacteria bacterium]
MEDQLQYLITANTEENRFQWAKEWKNQGKKVIGILSSEVPEEVITAAGMMPFRITGTWSENISHARVYRTENSCGYCNHVLESFLNPDLDFLDGVVIADIDQDLVRLWDVLQALRIKPFCHIIHIPFVDSALNIRFFTEEVKRLIALLEGFIERPITENALWAAIETHNQTRHLLSGVYDLRKQETPPVSGAEALGLITAATIIPKEIFNRQLESLLPYLNERKTSLEHLHPRILITSEMLDHPAYLELVEEHCLVAMDDMDTGSRYFHLMVDAESKDPVQALAERYLGRQGAPRMAHWNRQVEQIMTWVKAFNIDGVIGLPLTWCHPQNYRMPFLREKLKQINIPCINLDRAYHPANFGQLRTRIGAFVEMLGS